MRIKEIRKKRKLTGTYVAKMLNITSPHYYDIENGKKRIDGEKLKKLAEILETTTDCLLGLKEIIHRPDNMTGISPEWVEVVKESAGAGYTPEQVKDILKKAEEIAKGFRSSPLAKNDE